MDEQTPPLTPQPVTPIAEQPVDTPKKRRHISLKLKILIVIIGGVVLFFTTVNVKDLISRKKDSEVSFKKEQPTTVTTTEESKEFDGAEYKLTFKYPAAANLKTAKEDTKTIISIASGDITNPEELISGYIFTVVIYPDVINTDTETTAHRKRDSLLSVCTDSSSVQGTSVDTIPGNSFTLINCPYDTTQTFVVYNNSLYEFSRVYRGDLGYKEQYKQTAEQIMNSIQFLDKPQAEEAPKTVTYTNKNYQFSFVHPRMNSSCCNINGPVYGNPERQVVMADQASFDAKGEKGFEGFGVFVDSNKDNLSFSNYMDIQKTSLIEDYKIITGTQPETSEEVTKIGGEDAIILKGYTWWGGNLLYLQIPSSNKFMAISLTADNSQEFTNVMQEVFNSFKFNLKFKK